MRFFDATIQEHPLLTAQEEIALAQRLEAGDQSAIDEFILANLGLAQKVAQWFAGRGIELDDLIQEGVLGLRLAALKFNWRRGNRFSTYAIPWIRQTIARMVSSQKNTIRVPECTWTEVNRVRKAQTHLWQQSFSQPSTVDIAQTTGLSVDRVIELTTIVQPVLSLDMPIDQDGAWLREMIADPSLDEERVCDQSMATEALSIGMEVLSQRERRILCLRYGIGRDCPLTLVQTVDVLAIYDDHISIERVRQIEKRALRKIRATILAYWENAQQLLG